MSHSLPRNYLHIIFSTKDRYPFISEEIEGKLWAYIGGSLRNLECNPIAVGGHKDHMHILCLLSQKIALMKMIEKVKSSSSRWMKDQGNIYSKFYWQGGYGAFSVNPTEIDVVKEYILRQKEHHQNRSFQDEFRMFLKKYNIDYDERYVWD